ncbi:MULTISPECIES: hypothetical protein [unclassified Endozoicomonas]|uniref:hypothetical protein n=1 Tax=unclassified Endozoicomonas TaxID=2644528 RepID=UPI003BB5D095
MNLLRVSCLSLALAFSVPAALASPLAAPLDHEIPPEDKAPPASKDTTESSYQFSCGDAKGICGEEYCQSDTYLPGALKIVTPFHKRSSTDSHSQFYNLASMLLRGDHDGELERFCVDESLLKKPGAGFDIDQLEGESFWGILKLEQLATGQLFYVPLETQGLLVTDKGDYKADEKAADEVISYKYKLEISNAGPYLQDPHLQEQYGLAVMNWMLFSWLVDRYIQDSVFFGLSEDNRLDFTLPTLNANFLENGSPDVELNLTSDNRYGVGVVYNAVIAGTLALPNGDVVEDLRLESKAIRFPSYGVDHFRMNKRNPKGVSFVPSRDSQSKGRSGHFKVIDLELMPKKK